MDIVILADFCLDFDGTDNSRFIYIANMLKDKHDVEILTSDFNHGRKEYFSSVPDNYPYKITMLHEGKYKRNVCLSRFVAHYQWSRNVKKYLAERKKPDIVYCAIPPLSASLEIAKYCEKNKIRFIVDVQDLWPEAFQMVFNIPVISDVVFSPFKAIADGIYKRADAIVAVSETYKKRVLFKNKKCKDGTVVFLGTELDSFDKKSGGFEILKGDNEFWITYVGTLGHSYNIEIVIDALELLPAELKEKITFKVLGDGPLLEKFKEYAKGSGVKVDFMGKREYGEMVAYLKKSDIAVNPISKGAAQSIINKHGDYAMAGLPVVSTQESEEYRKLLTEYNCGINCSVDSPEEVADALKEFIENEEKRVEMGKNSRRLGEEKFDRKQSYKEILKVIENI